MGDDLKKGMISRIHLENFGTYDELTMEPERYLNIIMQPNGSGKPTIVAAIILGLGGRPNIIGQALHVGEYVKFGRDSARIEIHLKDSIKQDSVVTRTFTKEGKSTWMINGNQANAKIVQKFTSQLNIQVDNLSQFLPQDKVQDFSKMDAQTLLENTEKYVGDPKLLEYHSKLKEQRSHFKASQVDLANTKQLLKSKTQRRDRLQQVVATIKERKLKQKQAWILYDQMQQKLVESKKNRDLAVRKMQAIEAELKPLNEKVEQMISETTTLKNLFDDNRKNMDAKQTELDNLMDDFLSYTARVENVEDTCFRKIEIERTRDRDIKLAQNEKSQLENDFVLTINEMGSEESLTEQLKTIATNIEKHTTKIISLTNKNVTLYHKNENNNREISAVQEELNILNIDVKRLELLKQSHIDTYKAVLWVKKNRDKFPTTVHLPMMLNINVKEASYVKYLENIIPFEDLIAFTYEDKNDMNLLLKYLRDEQKLQVNVVHSDPMKRISMQPNIPIENIKKFVFISEFYFDLKTILIKIHTKVLDEYRANRNKYQQNIQHIQALKSKIHIAADNIMQLEMGRISIDDIEAICNNEIKSIMQKHIPIITNQQTLQQYFKHDTSNAEVTPKIELLIPTLFSKMIEVKELKDKFTTAERTFKKHDEEFQPLKREAERLYNEALASTNNISPQDDAFKVLNKTFEKLPAIVAEINNELNTAQANVFCMAENMDTETKQTNVLEEMTREIKKLKQKWLKPLGQLIEKINANFSSYFFVMDCAGEITLSHGENALDFDQYGLKIKIKFQDEDEFQELTRDFQRDGERMMITAIYMLALQKLSRVPFYCVDEINQDMDAVNVRWVFDLLVEMAGRPDSSQYFLFASKVPNLMITKPMTVHYVSNELVDRLEVREKSFRLNLKDHYNYIASLTDK